MLSRLKLKKNVVDHVREKHKALINSAVIVQHIHQLFKQYFHHHPPILYERLIISLLILCL